MDIYEIAQMADHVEEGDFLPEHPNRVLQLDTDGVLYNVCKPQISLESNVKQVHNRIEHLRKCAGAAHVNSHTTLWLKGGREQMAYYQHYQKKRNQHADPAMTERVAELRRAIRDYSSATVTPCPQWFVEADDSMTRMHNEHIARTGDVMSSVIGTDDKDLDMNCGAVMNLKTTKITYCGEWFNGAWIKDFGKTEYDTKKKKLVGRGHSFFWAQMLAGDTVDNIAGLPKLSAELANYYMPLKQRNKSRSEMSCGLATAAKVLSHYGSDRAAYKGVAAAYQGFFGADWKFFFFENAFLLWMRKTDRWDDVMNFLQPLGFEYELHPQQKQAIMNYGELCRQFLVKNGLL